MLNLTANDVQVAIPSFDFGDLRELRQNSMIRRARKKLSIAEKSIRRMLAVNCILLKNKDRVYYFVKVIYDTPNTLNQMYMPI